MADSIEKNIVIKGDTSDIDNKLKTTDELLQDLIKSSSELSDNVKKQNEATAAGFQKQEKGLKNAVSATKSLANGFRGVGLAFKAIGIGLLLEAFNILKDLFSQNQTVVDAFSIAFKSLSIIFSDFVGFINKNSSKVTGFFKDAFSTKGLKEFGQAILDNVQERVESYIDTLGLLAKGIGELFSGNFKKSFDLFKSAGKESIDIFTGVDDTVDKVVETTNELIDAGSKYLDNVVAQATAMNNLEKASKLLEASSARRAAQLEQEGEKLRQVRDDDTLAIADRIAANEKLKNVVNEQEAVLLRAANASLAVAKSNAALANTDENRIAVINELKKADDIRAGAEGKRSEQEANRVALTKELLALDLSVIDATNERTKVDRDFTNSLIKDDTDRLESVKKSLSEELKLETNRLTAKRDSYKQGTQAYVDANNELLAKQQEINNLLIQNENEYQDTLDSEKATRIQAGIDNEKLRFEERFALLEEQRRMINEAEYANEEERTAALKANSDKQIAIETEQYEKRKLLQDKTGEAIMGTAQVAGDAIRAGAAFAKEGSKTQKRLAIAAATIDTLQSAVGAYNSVVSTPFVGPYIAPVAAAAALAAGYANVKKISAVGGSDGGGSGGSSTSISAPPQFNTVGASPTSQLAGALATTGDQAPIEAQVVSSKVTSQQAADRQTQDAATVIG